MRKILKGIDIISEWLGSAARWLVVALVAITFWDVLLRYVFGHATMWAFETGMMLGGSIIALGWAYCQRHDLHIRVDVIYICLSPKAQAIINITGTLICFIPLYVLLTMQALDWTIKSWIHNYVFHWGYWFPPQGPFRTVVLIGMVSLFIQVLASFVRDLYFVTKGRHYD